MPHILLTGAGFSRNWGSWLADEAFEYLLGHPRIDDGIRTVLWRFKDKGGFEAALEDQRTQAVRFPSPATIDPMQRLEDAIRGMFADIDKAFAEIDDFNFGVTSHDSITGLLTRFDAIFTLNQDLLLERHYLVDTMSKLLHPRDWQIPGMKPIAEPAGTPINEVKTWRPKADPSKFSVEKSVQPYVKLHGSSNWFDNINGQPMLVVGANKPYAIAEHRILMWNFQQFREYLSKPETRLMVIGYSFRDDHINNAIGTAVDGGSLK